MRWLVPLLFLASGLTGLVYEVAWSRLLGSMLGNAAQAQAVVLATYMGGLALGNAWLGRRADRTAQPLALYGKLELGIAVVAGASPWVLAALDAGYGAIVASLPGPLALPAKVAVAAAALLPPTILMGGTLPILARHVTTTLGGLQGSVATLYFLNSAGAAAGALLAAFWLIPAFGVEGPIWLAAGLNAAIGVVALELAGLKTSGLAMDGKPADVPVEPAAPALGVPRQALFLAVALAGFAAMVLETGWIRVLSLVLGASTYSFAVMLAAFIAGIAIGAALVRRWAPAGDPFRAFARVELAAGVLALATLPFYDRLPELFLAIANRLPVTPGAFHALEAAKALVCVAVMLPPTACLGATLPLASRAAARALGEAGEQVGRVFAFNTAGNVLGALAGGFVLLPLLGMRGTLEVGAAICVGVGAAGMAGTQAPRVAGRLALAAVLLVAYRVAIPAWDQQLAIGGAFRRVGTDPADFRAQAAEQVRGIRYRAEDAHATVLVVQTDSLSLRINGKADASDRPGDMCTQVLAGHVPALLARTPRRALLVGLGSGVTAGSLLAHPLDAVDVVEISPAVVGAARLFADVNRRALDDPRLTIHEDDALHHLRRAPADYDMIVSEPSNPWIAGIGNLFTAELYAAASKRLAPGGVFVQWIHTYEIDDPSVALVLRTLAASFPQAQVWQAHHGTDIMLVAANGPIALDAATLAARLGRPAVAADLARVQLRGPAAFLAVQVLDDPTLRALPGDGPLNHLRRPLLENWAPLAFFMRAKAEAVWAADLRGRRDGADDRLLSRWLRARGRPLDAGEYAAIDAHLAYASHPRAPHPARLALLAAWHRTAPDDPRAAWGLANALGGANQPVEALDVAATLAAAGPGVWRVEALRAGLADQASRMFPSDPRAAGWRTAAFAGWRQAAGRPGAPAEDLWGNLAGTAIAHHDLDALVAARRAQAAAAPDARKPRWLLQAVLDLHAAGADPRALALAREVAAAYPQDAYARELIGVLTGTAPGR